MKRKLTKMIAAVMICVMSVSMLVCASPADENNNSDLGEFIGMEDLGDGWTAYNYVKYVDALSAIQPRAATQRTATKSSNIAYKEVYMCTISQTATFVYGAPDGIVTISSKSAVVSQYNSASAYRAGTITSTAANGSPATVTSTFGVFRASDWSRVSTMTVIMYCKNSGLIE
ncbi:MAG: hypothetical protein ACI39Q_06570 [Wujia sp.]